MISNEDQLTVEWRTDYRRAREKQENQLGGDGCLDQSGSNEGREKRLHSVYILKKVEMIGFPGRMHMGVWDTGAKVFNMFMCLCVLSRSVVSNSVWPYGPWPTRFFYEILQARTLEWVAIPFFREFSQPRDWTQVSSTADWFLTVWATRNALFKCICLYKTPQVSGLIIFCCCCSTPKLWYGRKLLCLVHSSRLKVLLWLPSTQPPGHPTSFFLSLK